MNIYVTPKKGVSNYKDTMLVLKTAKRKGSKLIDYYTERGWFWASEVEVEIRV